jgi:hypothetical protein
MKDAVKTRIAGAETRNGIIRENSQLSAAFVPGTIIDVEDSGVLSLLTRYTMGSGETGNSIVLEVELSVDGTIFYRETDNEVSLSVKTYTFEALSSPGTYDCFKVDVPIAGMKYARVSVKEIGVASEYGMSEVKYSVGW